MLSDLLKKVLTGNKKIGLVFGHVASNFGDVAITEGAIHFLKRFIPESNVHIVFQTPNKIGQKALDELLKRHPKISYSIWNSAVVKEKCMTMQPNAEEMVNAVQSSYPIIQDCGLDKCDVVLFNSGEHLFAYGEWEQDVSLFIRLIPLIAADRAGKNVMSFPSTFGPYQTEFSTKLFQMFVKACKHISVREDNSKQFVAKALKVNESAIPTLLDPAFYMFRTMDRSKWKKDPKLITVSVRLDQFGLRIGTEQSRINSAQFRETQFASSESFQVYDTLIKKILETTDLKIQLVIQTLADKKLTKALYNSSIAKFGDSIKSRLTLRMPASLFGYIKCVGESSLVLTSRFHSIIFGYAMGIPSIGIYFKEHGHKMPGLMSNFGQAQNCFVSGDCDAVKLTEKAVDLVKNSEAEGRKILSIIESLERTYIGVFKKCSSGAKVESHQTQSSLSA